MGECNYYLKSRFKDPAAAAVAEARLVALLAEGESVTASGKDPAGSASRRFLPPNSGPSSASGSRWEIGYLRDLAGIPDWVNGLAGHLGCLVNPRPAEGYTPRASLVRFGNLLLLQLNMIWHGTDMGLLESYCREELGAVGVGSISGEELEELWKEGSDLEDDEGHGPDIDPFEIISV